MSKTMNKFVPEAGGVGINAAWSYPLVIGEWASALATATELRSVMVSQRSPILVATVSAVRKTGWMER